MEIFDFLESVDYRIIVAIFSIFVLFFVFKRISKIFSGKDGNLDEYEFNRMLGCFTFLGLSVFVTGMDSIRDHEYYVFGPTYSMFLYLAFLSCIGQDKFVDAFKEGFSSRLSNKDSK